MSAPGDVGRRLEWVEGPAEEVLAKAAQLVGEAGGKSFEFGYDAVDRDLGEDEEPDPGEPVRWFVKAVWRYKPGRGRRPVDRTVIRYGVAEPGGARHDVRRRRRQAQHPPRQPRRRLLVAPVRPPRGTHPHRPRRRHATPRPRTSLRNPLG